MNNQKNLLKHFKVYTKPRNAFGDYYLPYPKKQASKQTRKKKTTTKKPNTLFHLKVWVGFNSSIPTGLSTIACMYYVQKYRCFMYTCFRLILVEMKNISPNTWTAGHILESTL